MLFRKWVIVPLLISLISLYGCANPGIVYARAQILKVTPMLMDANTADKAPESPLVEKYLAEGQLQAGENVLIRELKKHKKNDQLRFSLGTLQFLRAVEQLMQDFNRYGLRAPGGRRTAFLSTMRSEATPPQPELLTYEGARKIAQTYLYNLSKAEATLAQITDADVKLPLHFGMIRLDLDGDGKAGENETLWKLYAASDGNRSITEEQSRAFLICFDRGDVHWLRGYCHVFMTFCEIYLAHDTRETFDCTAHILFPRVESPYKFLQYGRAVHRMGDDLDIVDLIALVHLIRWPVVEPERMATALHHLEAIVEQSKESWRWIKTENDNDHEWLPNPNQTGVIPNMHVTQQMVDSWSHFMDQAGKALTGELLVPFWRGSDGCGINLRKVFLEPRTFDLVLWVQGPAAAPYLQQGQTTEPGTWRSLDRAFGTRFPGFAIWFN